MTPKKVVLTIVAMADSEELTTLPTTANVWPMTRLIARTSAAPAR